MEKTLTLTDSQTTDQWKQSGICTKCGCTFFTCWQIIEDTWKLDNLTYFCFWIWARPRTVPCGSITYIIFIDKECRVCLYVLLFVIFIVYILRYTQRVFCGGAGRLRLLSPKTYLQNRNILWLCKAAVMSISTLKSMLLILLWLRTNLKLSVCWTESIPHQSSSWNGSGVRLGSSPQPLPSKICKVAENEKKL